MLDAELRQTNTYKIAQVKEIMAQNAITLGHALCRALKRIATFKLKSSSYMQCETWYAGIVFDYKVNCQTKNLIP
jgi:hypothetical protein